MKSTKQSTLFIICLLLTSSGMLAQKTKRIKRPSSRIGVYSADTFVRESFDIYDKTYRYDGYAQTGTPLTDDDIDVLERALSDAENLLTSAPNVVGDLSGAGALKQAKGTLQLNRAKKALRYCIETIPKLLEGRKKDDETEGEDTSDNEDSSDDSTSGSGGNSGNSEGAPNDDSENTQEAPVVVNSKFDFVPGNELIFFDDFANDYIGDFPSKWNTNGSGEVVTFGDDPQKWFELKSGYNNAYVPDVNGLPEEYTIEMDVKTLGIDRQTSSATRFQINIEPDNKLKWATNYVSAVIKYPQFVKGDVRIRTRFSNGEDINNAIVADLREMQKSVHHISIAVNKRRFRLWVNQKKCIDVPRALPEAVSLYGIKLNLTGFKDGKERVFISNFKVAKGGLDLRAKLLAEGTVSTNGILFDSGSSTIKTQSYGIIRQISQVLKQDSAMKLLIVGHTDSDGDDAANMTLSKARAAAVRQALISTYGIDGSRLTTDGKGEADPIAGNDSPEGKSQNRRVVFTRQ
ncbi:MAG: OmpA family protein [Gilvibacter sp.]